MRFPELFDALPVIPTERPFKLFGRSFALRMSSHLTLEPSTLFWVLMGESLQQVAKTQGSDLFSVLRRGIIKKQRLSKTTLAPIRRHLRTQLPPGVPDDASLFQMLEALPKLSAWAMFERGFGEFEGEGLCFLTRRMAELEEVEMRVVALLDAGQRTEAEAFLVAHTGTPSEFWASHGIGILQVHWPLDLLCQALTAWETSRSAPGTTLNGLLSMLDPAKHPMGHWLEGQQKRAGCRSLRALADHAKVAEYDRLKAWSSGRDLLPLAKAEALVSALGDDETGTEMARYRWARVASFLCEWVICAAKGRELDWSCAQSLMSQRYRELLATAPVGLSPQAW